MHVARRRQGQNEGMSCRRLMNVAFKVELTVSHQRWMCGIYRMLGAVLLASQKTWCTLQIDSHLIKQVYPCILISTINCVHLCTGLFWGGWTDPIQHSNVECINGELLQGVENSRSQVWGLIRAWCPTEKQSGSECGGLLQGTPIINVMK